METRKITSDGGLDFSAANTLADAAAAAALGGEPICLSWYDRARDHECPAHASECHDDSCEVPGYVEYAQSRGAQLLVDVDGGAFVFCYLSAEEFES